jgi:ABC-type sugar transport system ATPase subunit
VFHPGPWLSVPPAADQIVLENVSKRYQTASGAVLAVDGVSFVVRRQEFLTLLGPSGCGKSTVLGMIGGLVPTDSGRISIDDKRV